MRGALVLRQALERGISRKRRQPPLVLVAWSNSSTSSTRLTTTTTTTRVLSSGAPQGGKPSVPASASPPNTTISPPPPGGEQPPSEVSEKEAARLKKIAKIKEEIRRGYFYELGQVNRTNSKLFEADKVLVPLDQARKFPSFEAESLLGVTHQFETLLTHAPSQVSLVAVAFRDSGFRVLPEWIKPFQDEFQGVSAVKVLQASFEDKTWLRLLKFLLLNGQKSNIERERHGQSFLRFGATEEIREGLGIDNRMVGYVFLVDGKGRTRWRGTGRPSEEEIGSLLKCAHELLDESASALETNSKKRFGKFSHAKKK